MKMKESELNHFLNSALKDSISEDAVFIRRQADNFDYYVGDEPMASGEDDRSSVVSNDCHDLVEADLPSLARIFLGSNEIMEFKPIGSNPDEIKEAEEKTKYINYLIRGQKDSYKTQIDWLKASEINTVAAVKFYVQEKTTTDEREYKGLSEIEMTLLTQDLAAMSGVESVDPVEQEEEEGLYNVTFRIKKKFKKYVVASVPIENFIFTRNATSKDDAQLIGDIQYKTKGALIADGWKIEDVKDIPQTGRDAQGQLVANKRSSGSRIDDTTNDAHWTSEVVKVEYLYPLVDFDGDGIPERRHIVRVADTEILENKPFGIAPYAIMSGITMPHVAIGRSRVEIAKATQDVKTHLMRGLMDNASAVSRPGWMVNDMDGKGVGRVELDDLLNDRINKIVRVDGPISGNILPLDTPFVGDKLLMTIQYVDAARAQTTGSLMAQQGLDRDALGKETATRFQGVADQSGAKVELVARNLAEIGYRDLYEGMAWLVTHYQDEESEIQVLGKPLKIDPRKWKYEHYCTSLVGLGAGDSQDMIANISSLYGMLTQMQSQGSLLVDSKKVYNAAAKIVKLMGLHNVSDYLNAPDVEPEQLMALLEQSMKQNEQLQSALQQAQPEMIRAKAQIAIEQNRAEIQSSKDDAAYDADIRKYMLDLAQKQEQWQSEMEAKALQFLQEQLTKRTELDLKYNGNPVNDIPGTLEDTI
jgi:hypothetical protein